MHDHFFVTGKVRQTISATEQERLEAAGVYLHEDQRKGTWADSEVERLLRAILKYCKQQGSFSGHEVQTMFVLIFWVDIEIKVCL